MVTIIFIAIIHYFLDPLVCLFCPKGTVKDKKHVLILRTDAIGDFILWLDAAKDLRRIYPKENFHITLIANKQWVDLAQGYSYWDEVIPLDCHQFVWKFKYRWDFLKMITQRHIDIAIYPAVSRIMLINDAIIRRTRAQERIGWSLDKRSSIHFYSFLKKILMLGWYTKLINVSSKNLMELQHNAEFMKALGLRDFKSAVPSMHVAEYKGLVSIKSEYFVIVPDASWVGKEWSLSNFIELSRRIQKATKWQLVWLGAHKDSNLNVEDMDMLNLMGKTSLTEYASIISKAKVVVGNNSSAVHIASACGVISFCITGGGHWGRFVPYSCDIDSKFKPIIINQMMDCYGCDWKCKFHRLKHNPVKCIADIKLENAWEVIKAEITKV